MTYKKTILKDYKLGVIFSILILSTAGTVVSFEDGFALKSKGTSLPEVGSKKVCGDRLCSEVAKEEQESSEQGMSRPDVMVASDDSKIIDTLEKKIAELEAQLAEYKTAERITMERLETFDELDFDVYTNQKWDRLHESHSEDIVVHWPDGRTTEGIEPHIEDLKGMFVFAPDTRIEQHPIKIASGDWTSVIGMMEGTFTEPMPLPDGNVIEPTGMSFKIRMVTVGHWNENGVMDEEYLFWDNQEFMRQIGLE